MTTTSRSRNRTVAGAVGVVVVACATTGAALTPNLRDAPLLSLALWGAAFAGAILALRFFDALPRRPLLFALIVTHGLALLGSPSLSDDQYRYVHEGRTSRIGLAVPYSTAPKFITPPPDDGISARVNHPAVPAAYPPTTQLVFAVASFFSDAVGAPFLFFRLLFFACDLAVLLLLYRRARRRDAFAWWGLHPLPILEIALSAHVDALGVALVAASLLLATKSDFVRGALIGLACGVKPIAALVWLAFAGVPKGAAKVVAGTLVAIVLCAAPYVVVKAPVFNGLVEYSTRWEAQAIGYALIEAPLDRLFSARRQSGVWATLRVTSSGLTVEEAGVTRMQIGAPCPPDARSILIDQRLFARALAGAFLLLLLGFVVVRVRDRFARVALAIGALWLLAPAVHPWYWLWALPFACVTGLRSVWAAALAAPLAYEAAMTSSATGVWSEAVWPRLVLLGFVCTGLALDIRERRRAANEGVANDDAANDDAANDDAANDDAANDDAANDDAATR